ncbi:RNA-directed DNA polymerase, eukaryota [Tanacetum coccineum]
MGRVSNLYLFLYNSAQAIGWAIALFRILVDFLSTKSVNGAYASAGELICTLQKLAFIEVLHGAIGIVPSGFLFPLLQWAGRTHFLLAIVRGIDEVQELPAVFITFVAWCFIEIIRYPFYALSCVGNCPSFLMYLRYTVFIVIYPTGVAGESKWLGFSVTFIDSLNFVHIANTDRTFVKSFSATITLLPSHSATIPLSRFQREPLMKKSTQTNANGEFRSNTGDDPKNKGVKGYSSSYVNVVKGSQNTKMESKPALVLDSTCVNQRDYSNFLMGKVKDIASLTNLKVVLDKEGFENIELKYMGGYWIMLEFQSKEAKQMFQSSVGIGTWFSQLQQASTNFIIDGRVTWVDIEGILLKMWSENTFKRIASIWGTLIHVEDQEEVCLHRKRICINTKINSIILQSFKIVCQGKVFYVRAKEISGWVPDFVEKNEEKTDTEDEINSKEFIVVPDSKFEEEIPKTKDEDVSVRQKEANSEDPMSGEDFHRIQEEESDSGAKKYCAKKKAKEDVAQSMCSGHFQKAGMPRSGGSILQLMDDMVKDYLSSVMENWNGKVVIMGDFNEVRKKAKRFGSVFNVQGPNIFNTFISNVGLEEVPLAVSLDRYLSDHRAILMRESHYDYGPVPFRYFHYWFEMEGFDKLVEDSYKEAPALAELDLVIDKREGDVDVVNKRTNVIKTLQELEKLQSLELAQKAKIKWAIEGDENSKYYHGILNKKRSRLAIRGILVDGNWIESPDLVKREFLSHFKNCFEKPMKTRLHIDLNFLSKLTSDQRNDLECEVTKDEIKKAVWDCGIEKSPAIHGGDGKCSKKAKSSFPSIWLDIVHEVEMFKEQGVERVQFDVMLEKVEGTLLADMRDRWTWSLEGSGEFFVASVRKLLDDKMLPEITSKTCWIKAMPIKVNVHA